MRRSIIIKLLVDKNIIQEHEVEIYVFGLECLILKTFNYLVYVLIGIFLKMPIELFFLSIPFISLRKSAGGFHADTKVRCFFFSIFCEVIALMFIRCKVPTLLIIIILVLSDITIIKLAPIDNESKRMSLDEKDYYKKQSQKRVIIFTVLSLGILPLEGKNIFLSMVAGISLPAILLVLGKFQKLCQEVRK